MTVREISADYGSEIIVRRWAATWVDAGVVFLLIALVGVGINPGSEWLPLVLLFGTALVYHTLFEGFLGCTPGKWMSLDTAFALSTPPATFLACGVHLLGPSRGLSR